MIPLQSAIGIAVVREASQLAAQINREGATAVLSRLTHESRARDLLLLLEAGERIIGESSQDKSLQAAVDAIVRARLALMAAGVTTYRPERDHAGLVKRGRRKARQPEDPLALIYQLGAGGSR